MSKTEFYRNNVDLIDSRLNDIEADSLFYLKNEKMILVDEDQYSEFTPDERFFRFVGYDLVEIKHEDEE